MAPIGRNIDLGVEKEAARIGESYVGNADPSALTLSRYVQLPESVSQELASQVENVISLSDDVIEVLEREQDLQRTAADNFSQENPEVVPSSQFDDDVEVVRGKE